MFEFKDEILNTLGQPDSNARYRIRDNSGNVLQDDVQLELKSPVTQEGTELNKSNLEKAIMTRIGRDYVANGGSIVNIKAGNPISQGDMVDYKITVDDKAVSFYNNYFVDASHFGGNMYSLPFEWHKEGLYLSTKKNDRSTIIVADFKKAIKNKSNLFTYDVKKEYTIVAPQTLSNYAVLVYGIKKVADNVFVIFYQYNRSWSYKAYNYAEVIGIDEEYNITSMSTISFSFSASSSSELLSFGENGEYLVGIVGNSSNNNGSTALQHLHISPNGTYKIHDVYSETSAKSRYIYFVQYNKLEENVIEFKFLYALGDDFKQSVGYKYNVQTDTLTKYSIFTETTISNSAFNNMGYCIIGDKRYVLAKSEALDPQKYIFFRYIPNTQDMSQHEIKESSLLLDKTVIAFTLNGISFVLQEIGGKIERVYYIQENGALQEDAFSEKLVGISFDSYVGAFGNSHEIAMVNDMPSGNVRYFLRAEPKAYKNSGIETTSNLQKVCGIVANTNYNEYQIGYNNWCSIYQIQGKEAVDATELVYN